MRVVDRPTIGSDASIEGTGLKVCAAIMAIGAKGHELAEDEGVPDVGVRRLVMGDHGGSPSALSLASLAHGLDRELMSAPLEPDRALIPLPRIDLAPIVAGHGHRLPSLQNGMSVSG
jgi:hypothetical protein